ncbi:DUF1573 domain-containing protein [Belliella kenyensis]|uniref:DUF1573 domain-containing protein n=1 Tax=Belliella kenyensis TaxID=1472724 RepID=A0ABV8EHY5_9BACT|nr:DUF1573 domain-containing protein [Belliella kenyensis]MCH7402362.1 DUF1573 domain-containing protein [Belliella kenyensis]MDN3603554.1 DUF1573 domain-containing protein [Belliella kenyensis]
MKKLSMSALLLAGIIALNSCSNNDQSEKISELEQKIAQMEASSSNAAAPQPSNVQTVNSIDDSAMAKFNFSSEEFEFGTIAEGKIVEHVFNFVNDGEVPLVISNVTASCGCTTPEYTKTPVKPGDSGFVKVVFNSAGKPGTQAPTVSIQANTNPNVNRLRLKGNVTPKNSSNNQGALGPVKQ